MAGTPSMKYAVVEREHRYVVLTPPDPSLAVRTLHLDDRYLRGTRLRLRRVREEGGPDVLKLGHKVRFEAHDPSALAHTSVYLDEAEFELLAALPADVLAKTRRHVPIDAAHVLSVDTFHGALDGLVLAELDLGPDRVLPATLPHGLGPDVTHDDRFTGAALAATDGDAVHALLADLGL